MSSLVRTLKERLAARRAGKPERAARKAQAKQHRIEMKRRHESDTRGGSHGAG